MKYLSNTIKMTLVVGILFFGLAVMSKADEVKTYKIQDTLNTVGQIPNKLANHISNEIEEIKVYQKKNWAEGKAQLARTFSQIKGLFTKKNW